MERDTTLGLLQLELDILHTPPPSTFHEEEDGDTEHSYCYIDIFHIYLIYSIHHPHPPSMSRKRMILIHIWLIYCFNDIFHMYLIYSIHQPHPSSMSRRMVKRKKIILIYVYSICISTYVKYSILPHPYSMSRMVI